MLDSRFIRENPDIVKKTVIDKGIDIDIDYLLNLDKEKREIISRLDILRREKKSASKIIPKAGEADRNKIIEDMKRVDKQSDALNDRLKEIEPKINDILLHVPNIPSEDTPIGVDESGNVEIEKWGNPPRFDFTPKSHVEICERLNLLDTKRGVKVAGFRGYFLKNELALLHHALLWHTFKKMYKKGFEVMSTPTLIKEMALIGSGHFPSGRDEIYEINEYSDKGKEQKFLSGTSEPALLAYRSGEIIDDSELPIKLAGLSPCYRREVGGYGKDTKGIYRVHEFDKVEQVVICRNDMEESLKFFDDIQQNALEILRELDLPHRVLQICTGDMGPGKYKMYDIETWMPSRNAYGETHSNSHLTDWQARRLKIRFRTKDGKIEYPYTMNNTAIASPRVLIAILENNQKKDGSVKIPDVLVPYLGFHIIKKI